MYGFIIKRRLKTRQRVVWWILSYRPSRLVDFLGLRWKHTDSLCIILRHVRSSYALACTQTRCFLELPISQTDVLSTRWINSLTSTKLALHCNYRFNLENCSIQNTFCCTVAIFSQIVCRGAISRWPKTQRFPLSFCGCHVHTRLMGTELCLFEIGWIILNNPVFLKCLMVAFSKAPMSHDGRHENLYLARVTSRHGLIVLIFLSANTHDTVNSGTHRAFTRIEFFDAEWHHYTYLKNKKKET